MTKAMSDSDQDQEQSSADEDVDADGAVDDGEIESAGADEAHEAVEASAAEPLDAGDEEARVEPMGPGQANLTDAASEEEALDEDVREGPGIAGTIALDPQHLMGALESLILVSDKPIAAVRLARLTRQDVGLVRKKLAELVEVYRGRGIVLDEIAGGFQFRTSPRFGPFVRNLVQQKPTKLTRAQLEVLSIIAYRQPVTRPEMEDVRGVDSGSAIKVLLERNVIKIIGKKDEAGRPMLYGTTNEFLELFGLKSLRDLPTLREFAELTPESRDMFERRIGEPVPGEGMNLDTHYTKPPDVPDAPEVLDDPGEIIDDVDEGEAAGSQAAEPLQEPAERAGEVADGDDEDDEENRATLPGDA